MARRRKTATIQLFTQGEDLPLFSGAAPRAVLQPFQPQAAAVTPALPGFELVACSGKFAVSSRRPAETAPALLLKED